MLKKYKWLSLILMLTALVVLAVVVLSLLPGKNPKYSMLAEMFGAREPVVAVSQLYFEVGRNRTFAHSGGSVAAAGTLGLQVLGPDGRETLGESFRLAAPALTENNGRFIAFDIGGTSLRVFNAENIISSVETEGRIVSASINKNGWFCIVTQEQTSGSRGMIVVYNNAGVPVFRVSVGSSFVLTAKLSDDNRNLVILGIAQEGSRITLYSGIDAEKDADMVCYLGTGVFLDIDYLSNTSILAIGEQSVLSVDLTGEGSLHELVNYEDKRLGGYTKTGEFLALHLYDYNIGYSGKVVTVDFDGNLLGERETATEIISMSSYEDTLMLLGSDGITFYSKYLDMVSHPDSNISAATAGRVLALGGDTALAANDLSAIVIRGETVP